MRRVKRRRAAATEAARGGLDPREEEADHDGRGREALGHEAAVDHGARRGQKLQALPPAELLREGQGDGEVAGAEAEDRGRGEVEEEGAEANAARGPDEHVLGIAYDGGAGAHVGRYSYGDEVGQGIPLGAQGELDHEGGQHQADRVVEEEGREGP